MAATAQQSSAKRRRHTGGGINDNNNILVLPRDPHAILSWNANGLAPRSKIGSNLDDFRRLLRGVTSDGGGSGSSNTGTATDPPDLICIQEARLRRCPFAGGGGSSGGSAGDAGCYGGGGNTGGNGGRPEAKELREVQPFIDLVRTAGYDAILWSLADGRKAGTLALIHRRLLCSSSCGGSGDGGGGGGGASSGGGVHLVTKNCAFTLQGALNLMLNSYGLEEDAELVQLIKLVDSSSSNDGSSNQKKQGSTNSSSSKQSSMMAFMTKKRSTSSGNNSNNNDDNNKGSSMVSPSRHDAEGRIQFLRFANIDILHTYVPNNGTKAESHDRRRQFDISIRKFLAAREAILDKAGISDRAVMWLGDLNVARTYRDGTHHTVKSKGDGRTAAVYEYWTDESKCYSKSQVPRGPKRKKGNIGIPGFTPNERRRFEQTLNEARLVDVWRQLHPDGVTAESLPYLGRHGGTTERSPWNRANYTWRGTMGKNQAMARYQGKAQRIDYFLLSSNAMDRVVCCDILGYGERREGYFCGSDHCVIRLVLKEAGDGDDGGDSDQKMPAKKMKPSAPPPPPPPPPPPAERDVIDLT